MNSLLWWQQRASTSSLNRARFEVTTDFTDGVNPVLLQPMTRTSFDPITNIQQNKYIVLKDIQAKCFLATCVEEGQQLPDQTSDVPLILYHTYDFRIRINEQVYHYPVSFNHNADEDRSQLYNALFTDAIKVLDVEVLRQFINPVFQGVGIPVTLSVILEFYTYEQ